MIDKFKYLNGDKNEIWYRIECDQRLRLKNIRVT